MKLNDILKNKKAITLISLVVTIVILVILAAVAINMTIGNNGLFNKTKVAKQEYTNSSDKERKDIDILTNDISEITGARDGISASEIQNMINKALYPNKSKTITAFTDTTTDQTYTVEKDGWLYFDAARTVSGYSIQLYRNNMEVYDVWGAPNSSSGAGAINTVYIPVKAGDIIKKKQNNTSFSIKCRLDYFE